MEDLLDKYVKEHTINVLNLIAKSIGVGLKDLCFCGSGLVYDECCVKKSGEQVFFAKNELRDLLSYKTSQGIIKFIPLKIWYSIEQKSIRRFKCVFPGCSSGTTWCHSIPDNILKKYFGSFCLEAHVQNFDTGFKYIKTGTGDAGGSFIFCNEHDSKPFKVVDDGRYDPTDKELSFLLAVKAITFSYRNVQKLLGIVSQIELLRPYLISNDKSVSKGAHFELSFPELKNRYTGFNIIHEVFNETMDLFQSKNYEEFSYFHRAISSNQVLFFSGFFTQLFDLKGKRINDAVTPVNMTLNIVSNGAKIDFFIACPPRSKKYYTNLLKQLEEIDDKSFMHFINKVMKGANEKPLLPLDFNLGNINKHAKMNFIKTS